MTARMSHKGLTGRKRRRLVVLSLALATLTGAVLLVLFALGRDSLSLFLQPSAVAARDLAPGTRFRLGGMVAENSFEKLPDGLTYRFVVTDCAADVPVRFTGLLPDLFREGQGVVTEGTLDDTGLFVADTVLAKHDENYAPPGTMPASPDACRHPEDVPTAGTGNGPAGGAR